MRNLPLTPPPSGAKKLAAVVAAATLFAVGCGTEDSSESTAVADSTEAEVTEAEVTESDAPADDSTGDDSAADDSAAGDGAGDNSGADESAAPSGPVIDPAIFSGQALTVSGETFELGELAGKDLVVWFWAPW